ncbi:hypothetical protein KIPB_014090, partial [Kipferlia bialata]|eukprot:g14090.t1
MELGSPFSRGSLLQELVILHLQ